SSSSSARRCSLAELHLSASLAGLIAARGCKPNYLIVGRNVLGRGGLWQRRRGFSGHRSRGSAAQVKRAVFGVDGANVVLSLEERWNTIAVYFYRTFPCVITRKRESHVTSKAIKQPSQVSRAAQNILARVKDVSHAEARSSLGHQLHQPRRSLWRNRGLIEARLRSHHRDYQARVEAVSAGCFLNQQIDCRIPGGYVMSGKRCGYEDLVRNFLVPGLLFLSLSSISRIGVAHP